RQGTTEAGFFEHGREFSEASLAASIGLGDGAPDPLQERPRPPVPVVSPRSVRPLHDLPELTNLQALSGGPDRKGVCFVILQTAEVARPIETCEVSHAQCSLPVRRRGKQQSS